MFSNSYSGIALSQSQRSEDPSNDYVAVDNTNFLHQTFKLPATFERGVDAADKRLPDLTGFSVLVEVTDIEAAALIWELAYDTAATSTGWRTVASGTTVGAAALGRCWFDCYFNDPIEMTNTLAAENFRLSFRGTGITRAYYTVPNPLSASGNKAYQTNGTTAQQDTGRDVSYCFRLFAAVADDGVDVLTNRFRSAVVRENVNHIATNEAGIADKYWLSKPNPSKFAVENLYFDIRDEDGKQTVLDRVLVDPLMPGPWMHIYYSNEGMPGSSEESWNDKIWTPVLKSFQITKRDAHALPIPVAAKYVKLEFSHLTAQHYNPGQFAQPTIYKKHPKWVLDYFLLASEASTTDDYFISRTVNVVWNTLDLAYNYYLDDLKQEPHDLSMDMDLLAAQRFLGQRDDYSDRVDNETLSRITTSLRPFRRHPALMGKVDYLLTVYGQDRVSNMVWDYPIERLSTNTRAPTRWVSTTEREKIIEEKSTPALYYYIPARHRYREVSAPLKDRRAYFVGIREVSFLRDHYEVAHDNPLYVEVGADETNIDRNDFTRDTSTGFWIANG